MINFKSIYRIYKTINFSKTSSERVNSGLSSRRNSLIDHEFRRARSKSPSKRGEYFKIEDGNSSIEYEIITEKYEKSQNRCKMLEKEVTRLIDMMARKGLDSRRERSQSKDKGEMSMWRSENNLSNVSEFVKTEKKKNWREFTNKNLSTQFENSNIENEGDLTNKLNIQNL